MNHENQSYDNEGQADMLHSESPNDGPGALLKKARLQLNLEISDAAENLHLSKNVIEAIEQDQYDKLAGTTFVKGYLRAYAKYLKLDANDVIHRFKALNITEPERTPTQKVIVREFKVVEKPVKWMSYVIALALGSLVIVWWHNHTSSTQSMLAKPVSVKAIQNESVNTTAESKLVNPQTKKTTNLSKQPTTTVETPEVKPKNPDTQQDLQNNALPSKTKLAGQNQKTMHTENTQTVQESANSHMDDISTTQHASAQTKPQKAHEGLKQFSGWQNPDIE